MNPGCSSFVKRRSYLVRRKEHIAEDGSLWLMAYSTDKDDLVLFWGRLSAISHTFLSPTRYASRGTLFRAISPRTVMNNVG